MIKLSLSKRENLGWQATIILEELEAPAKTAEELHISVATLRKVFFNQWKRLLEIKITMKEPRSKKFR